VFGARRCRRGCLADIGRSLRTGALAQHSIQRVLIEELFRDEKNLRYGWGLRQLSLSEAARRERMLLVLAFAYLLLVLTGLVAGARLSQAHWSATASQKKPTSASGIGRCRQGRTRFRFPELLNTLFLLLSAKENWG